MEKNFSESFELRSSTFHEEKEEAVDEKIGEILVSDAQSGKKTKISALWKDRTVVIHILRRFGCPLCRYGSACLSMLKPALNAVGVALVAVGFDVNGDGLYEFLHSGFWVDEVYLDPARVVYDALQLRVQGLLDGFGLNSKILELAADAEKKGFCGNFIGDGFQVGATIIVAKGGGTLYFRKQSFVGELPFFEDILSAVGANEEDSKKCLQNIVNINAETLCDRPDCYDEDALQNINSVVNALQQSNS